MFNEMFRKPSHDWHLPGAIAHCLVLLAFSLPGVTCMFHARLVCIVGGLVESNLSVVAPLLVGLDMLMAFIF